MKGSSLQWKMRHLNSPVHTGKLYFVLLLIIFSHCVYWWCIWTYSNINNRISDVNQLNFYVISLPNIEQRCSTGYEYTDRLCHVNVVTAWCLSFHRIQTLKVQSCKPAATLKNVSHYSVFHVIHFLPLTTLFSIAFSRLCKVKDEL